MRFTDPLWLLLLIPLAAGLTWSFRAVHGMARGRKVLAFGVRFLVAASLVVALAGPQTARKNEGVATIFVVDGSDSVTPPERERAEAWVRGAADKLGPNDVAGVVVFGRNPVVDAAPAGARRLGRFASKVDGSASDIASAVRLATALFPDGKARRIVLLSDGNETLGDLLAASEVAKADGIPIDVVALGATSDRPEASVIELEAPDEVRRGQPFRLRAQIDSTVAQAAVIELDRDGVLVQRQRVALSPGRNAIVLSQDDAPEGFARYRLTLRPAQDSDTRNNLGMAFTNVKGRPKVLVLQDRSGNALISALRARGIVADVAGPGQAPTRVEQLQGYEAVLLNDYNARHLAGGQMKLLQAAVRDSGIGLAMIGGENSFLPGGYYGTPVAEALPVDLNIRQRKSFPASSVLIVIDCSGSMAAMEDGVQKLKLAAKAAEETVKLLSPYDRIGVAGSTDGIEFVAPMQNLTNKDAVINQVRRIAITGGGIYIGPSVIAAEKAMRGETSKVRHIILLADGADSTDWRDAIPRTFRMRQDKITTTVVAIGDGKDVPQLRQLAAAGGGRFYLATKAAQLPAIFTQDAAVMTRSAIEEGAFVPKVQAGEEMLRGLVAFPPLLAYCLADARPLANVAMRTHKDDPLLATWQYGLGTGLAFTSDAQARWAAQWVGWGGFDAFWAQAVRAISRRTTQNQYQVSVRNEGGRASAEIVAKDRLGNPADLRGATVRVATPNGTTQSLELRPEAPGRFSADFDAGEIGTYIVTVGEPDAAGGTRVSSSGFSVPYPPEYRSSRANQALLARAAETTGGRTIAEAGQMLRPVERPGESIADIWVWFVLAAGLLFPVDVAVRRLALPIGEAWAKLRARVARRPAPENRAERVGRLAQAKQRAHSEVRPAPESPASEQKEEPSPRPTPKPTGKSASSALLEAKRKKKG